MYSRVYAEYSLQNDQIFLDQDSKTRELTNDITRWR